MRKNFSHDEVFSDDSDSASIYSFLPHHHFVHSLKKDVTMIYLVF